MISGSERRKRIAVVLGICMPVVVLHFVTGTGYHGPARWFVNGYLIDMLLPFYLYFLAGLALEGKRRLHSWPVRAAAVLAIGACIETLQGFQRSQRHSSNDPRNTFDSFFP